MPHKAREATVHHVAVSASNETVTGKRPETELLLRSMRVVPDPDHGDPGKELFRTGLDWNDVVRSAAAHWVTPLLYSRLQATCPDAVPPAVLAQLRDGFRNNIVQNLFLTGELLTLLELFESQAIRVLPFKGLTLAAVAYGDPALRYPGDLDLLIPERDVPRARALLAARGYRPRIDLSGAQETAYLRSLCQLAFVRDDSAFMVELHTQIMPRAFPFPLDCESLWPRRVSTALGGRQVPSLAPEDLLLVLCVHGAKHVWSCLRWICDVAQLVRARADMDWTRVTEQARVLRIERVLSLGLVLAADLLAAPVPEHIVRKARADPRVASLALEVSRRLFGQDAGPVSGLGSMRFHFRVRERRLDGIRYGISLATVPTPADWVSLRLPAPLFPVYYVLRAMRLAGKYVRMALRSRS